MTNLKLNLAWIFLIALMGCKAPASNSTPTPISTPTENAPYAGHLVYVSTESTIWTYQPDSQTGELKTMSGTPVGHNGTNCVMTLSPKKTFLFAACDGIQDFMEYRISESGVFTESGTQALNPAGVSTNYNADGIAFDSSNNLFVHYTENISPNTEKLAQFTFNEVTNTFSFVGWVTNSISMPFAQSGTLDDLTYFLNTDADRVDMYQDGSLTSYSLFMGNTPISIVVD